MEELSKSTRRLLEQYAARGLATTDEDVDAFLTTLSPEDYDSDEMGSAFEQSIGYNPITFYDRKFVEDKLDESLSFVTDDTARENIANDKDGVIDIVMEEYESGKDECLTNILRETLVRLLGFDPVPDDDCDDDDSECCDDTDDNDLEDYSNDDDDE